MKAVPLSPRLLGRWLAPRRADSHKGDFGHVLVVAGSKGLMGAARLCAAGALRGGAGLVTLAVPESQYKVAASGPWEVMTLPMPEADGAFHPRSARLLLDFMPRRGVTALALGPGLSTKPGAAKTALSLLDGARVPVVADADALNALAAAGRVPRRKTPWVLTPHPGEAARLLGRSTAAVQRDRPAAARDLAERFGGTALLKGAGTLIAGEKFLYRNTTGHPAMASGGMGDALTGLIAALLGQVSAGGPGEVCSRAAALGAWLHGRAGEAAARDLGPAGVTATDLLARVPGAFRSILSRR